MIMIPEAVSTMTGLGWAVVNETVCGSMRRGSPMALAKVRKLEVGPWARCTEKTTSSAVKSPPSCHFTPLRSRKTQVVGFCCVQPVARPGSSSSFLPRRTSGS